MFRSTPRLLMATGLCLALFAPAIAAPQSVADLQKQMQEIQNSPMPEEQKQKIREQLMKQMGEARKRERGGPNRPGGDNEKKDEGKKDEGKKDGKDEKGDSKTVKRGDKPKKPADPKELEARPTNGKLILNFHGQPWPAMIDWYSRVTNREIEWQELPGDFVNLRTQSAMTLQETGDLLNRLLLARGFTMLDDGGFVQVMKTEGINPAFVPRVQPRQLATLPSHSFVRTSFLLQRFKAEDIVKELEAMKSQHGKLTPMTAANRIEAMDMVLNLRDIYTAIDQEQSSGNHKPREFVVRYVRAELIKEKIGEMLGIAKEPTGPMSPQQMQQMMQRRQQEQQRRQQQQQQNGGAGPKKTEEKISIIVNDVKNSLIIKAPPHRMMDIADAIELLDVRPDSNTLDIKAYTLATRSPQELADLLNESGALSPTAIVRVDKNTKTLLVSGSQFDHFKIGELIKSIDGNARRFESIQLRRYPAAQVAATIEQMMGKPKEDNNRRRRYYWWDDNQDDEDESDKFQVTADVENNRLILKCNDSEYNMVMELLTQMGEVLTRSSFAVNEVVLDDVDASEDELLMRVKQAFEAVAPNSVVLPPPAEESTDESDADDEESTAPAESQEALDLGRTTSIEYQKPFRTVFTQLQVADANANPANPGSSAPGRAGIAGQRNAPQAPPVVIERNAQGKLVIRSSDPKALELFEEMVRRMAPKSEDWVSFKTKHVTALWMRLQLEDFFEDDDGDENPFGFIFWGYDDRDDDDRTPGLGEERKMRFIDDGESTLVVRNASPKQLATIKRLIELYDVAEPPNENSARYKKIIQIKYSKARVIETALKEAFRDLLSSNDKAFAEQNKGDGERGGGNRRFGFGFGFGSSDNDSGLGTGSNFKGRLSFGVDESTNILIITAQGRSLLELVVEMVEELDTAAVPTDDTRVVALPQGLSSESVKETLRTMFGPEAVTQRPNGQPEGEGGEQPGPNNGGRGGPRGPGPNGRGGPR